MSLLRSLQFLFCLSGLVSLTSCGPEESEEATAPPDERVFSVKGVVQEAPDLEKKRIVIDHEEMPGYMRAMIMPFKAKDAAELKGLEPGMVIQFDYHVQELQSWIENVKATGESGEVKVEKEEDTSATVETAEGPVLLSEGELLPDYEFVDENGKDVNLSDFRGMPVALTFVFTRCPVPEYCPAMMRNFSRVNAMLSEKPEGLENYHLLTISFDTWNDTPELMKEWGALFGHKDGQPWSLLTSDSCCTINEIGANVGLKFGEVNDSYQHNLRTVVLNPDGTIRKIFTDETWQVEELVDEIRAAGATTDT